MPLSFHAQGRMPIQMSNVHDLIDAVGVICAKNRQSKTADRTTWVCVCVPPQHMGAEGHSYYVEQNPTWFARMIFTTARRNTLKQGAWRLLAMPTKLWSTGGRECRRTRMYLQTAGPLSKISGPCAKIRVFTLPQLLHCHSWLINNTKHIDNMSQASSLFNSYSLPNPSVCVRACLCVYTCVCVCVCE